MSHRGRRGGRLLAAAIAALAMLGLAQASSAFADVSIGNVAVSESGGNATFTVSLTAPAAGGETINYASADGTAIAGSDYTATGAQTITFLAGETSQAISVPITDDTVAEVDETFTVTLSGADPALGPITTATGTGTIVDNDVSTITVAGASATEGSPISFAVSLSNPNSQAITLTYNTADGTALAPGDYTAATAQTIIIPALATSATITVPTAADAVNESAETFTVTISGPTPSGSVGAQATATGTINDNNPLSLTISDAPPQLEGTSGTTPVNLTVTLAPVSTQTVTVSWATGLSGQAGPNATEDVDYVRVPTLTPPTPLPTVTFAPGVTTMTVTVLIKGDLAVEPTEAFGVILSNPTVAATLPARPGLVIIVDDDQTPIPPVANPDVLATARNVPGNVNVLANDTDANGDFLFVTNSTPGAHGDVVCAFLGTCTYTPGPGYLGPDTFTYTVNDGLRSTVGTVTVTVFRPNTAPVAKADKLGTVVDHPFAVRVVANDTDAEGDRVRVTGAKNGRHGAVRCTATICTYRPKKGYAGTDAFTYTVSDGTLTATGTVKVTVKRKRPLRASATAAPRTARSGDVVTYTVAVTNPNPLPVDLRAVRVCLPPGFTFVGGSTGGALRRAPAAGACGRNQVQLTWSKTPPAPAGGRVAIRFKAHAGTAGSAGLAVAATAGAPFAVTSPGSTATVAVTR